MGGNLQQRNTCIEYSESKYFIFLVSFSTLTVVNCPRHAVLKPKNRFNRGCYTGFGCSWGSGVVCVVLVLYWRWSPKGPDGWGDLVLIKAFPWGLGGGDGGQSGAPPWWMSLGSGQGTTTMERPLNGPPYGANGWAAPNNTHENTLMHSYRPIQTQISYVNQKQALRCI